MVVLVSETGVMLYCVIVTTFIKQATGYNRNQVYYTTEHKVRSSS